jgi:hypothetical protein
MKRTMKHPTAQPEMPSIITIDGRIFHASCEKIDGLSYGAPASMVFIKEGEAYVPLEEQARLEWNYDAFKAWRRYHVNATAV